MNSSLAAPPPTISQLEHLVREHLRIFAAGDLDAVDTNVTSDYLNHRSIVEPLECAAQKASRRRCVEHIGLLPRCTSSSTMLPSTATWWRCM